MSAAAANEIRPPSAEACSPACRADLLWDKEIAQIRAARPTMTPSAIACVRAVLDAILHEADLESTVAASTRHLLDEIGEQAIRTWPRPGLQQRRIAYGSRTPGPSIHRPTPTPTPAPERADLSDTTLVLAPHTFSP
jgi:hypothetical protein